MAMPLLRPRRRIRRQQSPREIYRPRCYLLTRNEADFFRVLATMVTGRYLISCKVRLADIITCPDRDWKRGHANRIAQKHVDFVISCPRSSRIVAAIELDDRSHLRPERRERDAFVNQLFRQTHVRLIRVPARWTYDKEMIAKQLAKAGLSMEKEIDPGSISPKPMNLRRVNPSK